MNEIIICNGIQAMTHKGEVFYFFTESQEDVENAMLLMGFGSRDYNLGFFKNRILEYDK